MKSTTQIRLPRTGDVPLVFCGRRVAAADSHAPRGNREHRWHELELYQLADGRLAAAVAFCTRWDGEDDHYSAWLGAADDIRDALRQHDPLAALAGWPPGAQFAARQERLRADLVAGYRAAITHLYELAAAAGVDLAERVADAPGPRP